MEITNILNIILYILAGLLMLTILVIIHEGGHFLVGKKLGIGVVEFSVGMGPKIFSRIKKGIRYSVRCLPIGGYVQFLGEDENDPDPKAFNNQSAWKRLLTLIAGPFMNLIFALVITVIVLISFGDAVIVNVQENSPAYEAGLLADDRIVGINGVDIDFYSELVLNKNSDIFVRNTDYVELDVERDNSIISHKIPFKENEDGTKTIGIMYGQARHRFGFFESISLSFKWLFLLIVETISGLWTMIFGGQGTQDLMGPIGTIMYAGKAWITYGGEIALRLISLISINLAIVNLLPFPGLDGGRVLFLGIEKVTGNRVSKKIESVINLIGLLLLLVLIVFLTIQDISRGLI